MASAKNTFEPNVFEANTFACGAWRGVGVESPAVTGPYRVAAGDAFTTGQLAGQPYVTGRAAGDAFVTGRQAGQIR
jgi:hypothetical protein